LPVTSWLRNAFAVDPPGPATPNEEERKLVERFAHEVVRRGLTSPALMFLECSHSFNFLASQFLVFAAPILSVLFRGPEYQTLTRFLDRRGSVEYICRRIEAAAAAKPQPPTDPSRGSASGGAGVCQEPEGH
jgi:hypothetical protein